MASKPPLGIALADTLGAAPKMSKGQIIAGIIGDALAGAAGRAPVFGEMIAHQREQDHQSQQEEAQWGRHLMMQRQLQQQFPEPSPMERDTAAWQHMGPDQRAAYQDMQKAREGDPIVTITLRNGQMYSGPRSGLATAMTGGMTAPQGPVGKLTPIDGGPTQPASGGFPTSYPNIGPYKRY